MVSGCSDPGLWKGRVKERHRDKGAVSEEGRELEVKDHRERGNMKKEGKPEES